MSAPAINPDPGYFSQPSTRLNIVQWLAPFLIAFVWFLISSYFNSQAQAQKLAEVQQAQTQQIAQSQQTEARYQQIKEERIRQLTFLESEAKQRAKDTEEIKAELRDQRKMLETVLQRTAH